MPFFRRLKGGKQAQSPPAPIPGKSVTETYQEAARFYMSKHYQQAASLFEQVINADPNSAAAHESLAHCCLKLIKGSNDDEDYRMTRRCVELLERALELNESHGGLKEINVIEGCFTVGIFCQVLREFPRSIAYLERCLKHAPTHFQALLYLSTSYHHDGNDKEALDKAICAFRLQPMDERVHSQLMSAADWIGVDVATGLSTVKRQEILREFKTARERIFREEGGVNEDILREGYLGRGYPADVLRICRDGGGTVTRDRTIQTISDRYHLEGWVVAIIWREAERNGRDDLAKSRGE